MATLRIQAPKGERPLVDASLLEDTAAQVARNVRLNNGAIRPLKDVATVQATTTVGQAKTVFKYSDTVWLEWETDVDVVRSPIANDAYDRVYYTGDGVPKVTYNAIVDSGAAPYPTNAYTLGVPEPTTSPTATVAGTPDDPNDLAETRYYVVTYVDVFGAEGPPCLPSNQVEVKPGQTVDLAALPGAPTGNFNVVTQRIYRVNTGQTGSVYQFVADVPIASATYNDAITSDNLGEALTTTTYDMPPATLKGLVALPGGFFAGFYGNVLCFCEPGLPHAWPVDYQKTTTETIVGIGVYGNTIVVATEGEPYICQGIDPASMSMTKLEIGQAGVSKRSATDVGIGVIYASPDGLVLVKNTGVELITEGLFDREQWQALNPASMHGYLWEGVYLCFYDTGTVQASFAIDPAAPDNGVLTYDTYVEGGYRHKVDDALYFVVGSNIVQWDAGSDLNYTWESKEFHPGHPVNMGYAHIKARTYPVTFTLTVDDVVRKSVSVTGKTPIRLPAGYLGDVHVVKLEGTGEVYDIVLATTADELRNV